MITPANALKFSLWLAANHPRAFQAVLDQTERARRPGLGAVETFLPARRRAIPPTHARGRFGRFGDVWSDIDAGTYDPNALRTQVSADDLETFTPSVGYDTLEEFTPSIGYEQNPTLFDINTTTAPSGFDLSTAARQADTSGGFWSSLGSELSSIGSGLSSAIGKVTSAVLNPQTLSAAGNLAATVIKTNGATQQQQALLQAQVQRTANGTGAHPVTYATNPATGQPMAMLYNPATGQYQPAGTGALGVAGSLTPYVPYILMAGGLVIVALLARR